MARQVVFLVHGIGEQKPKWSAEPVAYLNTISERYASVKEPISKQIDFVEVNYGDVFDKQLARWDQDVDTFKVNGVVPQAKDAVAWLDGVTEGGFVWTHIGDVVLFLSRLTRAAAVSEVVAQMAATISKENDAQTQFSIIAHSMGTAVTMEAVNSLCTAIPDVGWPGMPDGFMFREIMMLSNTSRLLQRPELTADGGSRMLPVGFRPDGLCGVYRNVFHQRDPVSWPRRFKLTGASEDDYVDVTLDHYYGRNLHDLTHYFEHPAVHGALLRLPAASNLPLAAWRKARDEYDADKRFGGEFSTLQEVKAFVSDLAASPKPNPESPTQLVNHLKYIVDVLRKMV
ncbi:MAG: hypothetical protein ABIP90_00470 [Vicinamibacterales bacterium]